MIPQPIYNQRPNRPSQQPSPNPNNNQFQNNMQSNNMQSRQDPQNPPKFQNSRPLFNRPVQNRPMQNNNQRPHLQNQNRPFSPNMNRPSFNQQRGLVNPPSFNQPSPSNIATPQFNEQQPPVNAPPQFNYAARTNDSPQNSNPSFKASRPPPLLNFQNPGPPPPSFSNPPLKQLNQPISPSIPSPAIVSNDIQLSSSISSDIPLILHVQPLNKQFTSSYAIIRCRRCRTYLNCYCTIKINKWQCNTCQLFNNLESNDPNLLNPIMSSNSVEYYAPQEYMIRPPMSTCYYVITDDLQYIRAMIPLLNKIPHSQYRCLLGFIYLCQDIVLITENGLHIYNDIENDLILPRDELLMKLYNDETTDHMAALLTEFCEAYESMPSAASNSVMNTSNSSSIRNLTPLLSFMSCVLKPLGGTILAIIKSKATIKNPKQIALEASRSHIGIDSYHNDNNELYYCSKYTGGNIYKYQPITVSSQLMHYTAYWSNRIGLESVLRIRASNGLRAVQYYGQFFTRSSDLLAIANIHPQNTYLIEYTIEEPVVGNAVFQCALLHTSDQGDRRIRVLTCCVPNTSIKDALTNMNSNILLMWMGRMAIERGIEAQEAILNKIGDIMQLCQNNRVNMPRDLMALGLGLIKTPILRQMAIIPIRESLNYMTLEGVKMMCRPIVVNVENIINIATINDMFQYCLGPSTQYLTHDGLFLILSPLGWYLWMSRDYNGMLMVKPYEELESGEIQLDSVMDNGLNRLLRMLYEYYIDLLMIVPVLKLVKETGDPYIRQECLWTFVDDKSPPSTSKSEQK
eukprot:NODE_634_length_5747_cov_0.333569.p1 type:complete len:797 gc:universal NODE_634_length_5747_cov_0.333569:3867-1477(-)